MRAWRRASAGSALAKRSEAFVTFATFCSNSLPPLGYCFSGLDSRCNLDNSDRLILPR